MKKPETLSQWLDNLALRHPQHVIELGLDRSQRALQALGFTCPKATRVVTVAGTNGKGSVAMLLAEILKRQGLEVGVYTSPHLYDFRERLTVNGQCIAQEEWVEAFRTIDTHCHTILLTFFEWVTLAALLLLQARCLDVWILEIGLGGRLDVVNCVDNNLNLITSIGFDHTDRLGTTLDAIATEKAGVMRPGVTTICGSPLPRLRQLAGVAGAQLLQYGRDWQVQIQQDTLELSSAKVSLAVPFPEGVYPTNLAMALLAAHELEGLSHAPHAYDWLGTMQLPGRLERVTWGQVRCLVDVAHNQDGIAHLAHSIVQKHPNESLVAVFACLNDKHMPPDMARLFPQVHTWVVPQLHGARAQNATDIIATHHLPHAYLLDDVTLPWLRQQVGTGMLLVFGSFHLPSLVKQWLCQDTSTA